MAADFWKLLSKGNKILAQEIGLLIRPPAVSAFLFEGFEDEEREEGTLTVLVVSDTPSTVMDLWNQVTEVHVMVAE